MKRETVISVKTLALLSALLVLLSFTALPAHADFYVIAAGGRGVGTEIKSLPHTISSPGFYYITKDLSCSGSHGIIIDADNVTLDLMGFSLIGSGTGSYDGIYMDGRSNVEIRNGTVRNFGRHGIYESNTSGKCHRVINIRARDNGDRGICFKGYGNLVKGCTATGNVNTGIEAGFGATVTGNTCYDNGKDGIYAGSGSTVTGNTCRNNVDYGIYLAGYNLVDQNTAYFNAGGDMDIGAGCVLGINVGAP